MNVSLPAPRVPKAVLFDLLTALLDSWSLWNRCAGSEEAGRAWRAEYLKLTYGCGAYEPYETLVAKAARNVDLSPDAAVALETNWYELQPWDDAIAVLEALRPHCRLAVVTNCSTRLGHLAAAQFPIEWDAIVTAEEAGFYKPDPRPYQLALDKLKVAADDAVFVAGSSYDLFGTAQTGLRTYWHNRIGLTAAEGAPAPDIVAPTLAALPAWVSGGAARPAASNDQEPAA